MSSRHVSDYVVILHGLDEWLVPAPGISRNLASHLDSLASRSAIAYFESKYMHSFGNTGRDLVHVALWRHQKEDGLTRNLKLAPHLVFRPEGVAYIDTHVLSLRPKDAVAS